MNQKITKLVKQALKECVATPVESVIASRIDDHGIVEIPNTFAEKFAELIVKECLEACSRANEIRHFVPPTQEQVVLSCMREIETTFWS